VAEERDDSPSPEEVERLEGEALEAAFDGGGRPEPVEREEEASSLSSADDTSDSHTDDGKTPDSESGGEPNDDGGGEQEQPDPLAAMQDRIEKGFRELNGRFGTFNRDLMALKEQAKSGTITEEQLEEKLDQFAAMREDFPELGDAIEEKVSAVEAKLRQEFSQSDYQEALAQAKEEIRVDIAHPGWMDEIVTPEFQAWMNEGGPTESERARLNELRNSSPEEAVLYENEIVRQYPTWYAERGSKADSPKSADAIALLDAYKAAREPDPDQTPSASSRQSNVNRLAANTPPKRGGKAPARQSVTEEEAMLAAFNR